jgi:hypothetical protein
LAKTDGNDKLAEKLQEIISSTDLQKQIEQEKGKSGEEGTNG